MEKQKIFWVVLSVSVFVVVVLVVGVLLLKQKPSAALATAPGTVSPIYGLGTQIYEYQREPAADARRQRRAAHPAEKPGTRRPCISTSGRPGEARRRQGTQPPAATPRPPPQPAAPAAAGTRRQRPKPPRRRCRPPDLLAQRRGKGRARRSARRAAEGRRRRPSTTGSRPAPTRARTRRRSWPRCSAERVSTGRVFSYTLKGETYLPGADRPVWQQGRGGEVPRHREADAGTGIQLHLDGRGRAGNAELSAARRGRRAAAAAISPGPARRSSRTAAR